MKFCAYAIDGLGQATIIMGYGATPAQALASMPYQDTTDCDGRRLCPPLRTAPVSPRLVAALGDRPDTAWRIREDGTADVWGDGPR